MVVTPKLENPWNIESLYDLQYFNCPSCSYKNSSKQDFVCHSFDTHPDSVDYLRNIVDGSLSDILCPWDNSNDYKSENSNENNAKGGTKDNCDNNIEKNDESISSQFKRRRAYQN